MRRLRKDGIITMAFCPQCGASFNDGAPACPQCGTVFAAPGQQAQQQYQQPQFQQQYQQPQFQQYAPAPIPVVDPKDHTAEFDPKDISDNKITAMAPYILGVAGLLICLLAAGDSKYAGFHARNALKLTISQALLVVCCIIPFLGWIAAGIGNIMIVVINIICFVHVCQGKAKEAPIFGSLPFFK